MKLMQITLTLDISPQTSPLAVQQMLDWAVRINAGETGADIPAPKANGHSPAQSQAAAEKALFDKLVQTKASPKESTAPPTKAETGTGYNGAPISDGESDPEDGEGTEEETSQPTAQPAGALPPGIENPVKRKGGRPSKAMLAERAAAAAAAEAAVNPALVAQQPQSTPSAAARPPGFAAPAQVQPQQPAMPQSVQDSEYSNGIVNKEDVKACYTKAVAHDPKGVHAIMRANNWADGESKPQWFTVEGVAPVFFDRLYNELGALIPAEG